MKYTDYHDYPAGKKYKVFGLPFMISIPIVIAVYTMLILQADPLFLDQGLFAILSGLTFHKYFFSEEIFNIIYCGTVVLVLSLVLFVLFRLILDPLAKKFGKNRVPFGERARFIFISLLFLIPFLSFNFLLVSIDGKMLGLKQAFSSTFSGCIAAAVVILVTNGPALLVESCIYNRRVRIRTVYTLLIITGILFSLWAVIQLVIGHQRWSVPVPLPLLALFCTIFYAACYLTSLFGREGWRDIVYLRPFRFLSFLVFLFFNIILFYYIGTANKNDTIISMITIVIWFFFSWYCLSGLSGHISFPKSTKNAGGKPKPARKLDGPKAFQWAYLGFSIAGIIFTIEMFFKL